MQEGEAGSLTGPYHREENSKRRPAIFLRPQQGRERLINHAKISAGHTLGSTVLGTDEQVPNTAAGSTCALRVDATGQSQENRETEPAAKSPVYRVGGARLGGGGVKGSIGDLGKEAHLPGI